MCLECLWTQPLSVVVVSQEVFNVRRWFQHFQPAERALRLVCLALDAVQAKHDIEFVWSTDLKWTRQWIMVDQLIDQGKMRTSIKVSKFVEMQTHY